MFVKLSSSFLLLLLFPLFLSVSFGSITKPVCPDRCGNVEIPFPFGVGSNCSFGPAFDIICNTSTHPPKPFIRNASDGAYEVVEINPSQVRIKYPYLITANCHHDSADDNWQVINFTGSQFTLSDDNWLTALGCDDVVLAQGSERFGTEDFRAACVTYCRNDSRDAGFCPGYTSALSASNGCCQASIPRGSSMLFVESSDLSRRKMRGKKRYSCSYSFIQEKGIGNESAFSYPLPLLNNSLLSNDFVQKMNREPPVMRLDWRINAAENCSNAGQNSTSYACKDNTVCVDLEVNCVGGYLCLCVEGYHGNPYLSGGCQDIDECADSITSPCNSNAICKNTPGSFSCSCPMGYLGVALKNGTGCFRQPRSNTLTNILTGLGSGLGFILLLAMCIWLNKAYHKRKKQMCKDRFFKRNGGLLLKQQTREGTLGRTKVFSAQDLEMATDHFNESRFLGKGGQGTVYKGMLSDGKIVAIKKSKVVDDNLLAQFINEVVILSQINHRNVVNLLGCCLETDVPLLVYEFLPNGTLFDLIHNPENVDTNIKFQVSWSMRLKIATDIAGALAYIHSASSVPIYHRDIKSQNFLLDEKLVVKLADFGISRSIEVNQTHLTTIVKGTFGYLDPEYFHSHQYSEKSEVYSFGVVLAELLSGKRPIFSELEDTLSLAERFVEYVAENRIDEIIDPQILVEYGKKEEMSAVAKLAHRCLNSKGKFRPTMKEVAAEMESLWISQMPPPTTIEQYEESRGYNSNSMVFSDMEETWTSAHAIETLATSDTHAGFKFFKQYSSSMSI